MNLENSLILLEQELQNNNRKVTSKFIAEYFSKQHKHILSDVRESNEIYEKLDLPKIRPIFLKDSYGRKQPAFLLNEKQALNLVLKYDTVKRILFIEDWDRLKKKEQQELKATMFNLIDERDKYKNVNNNLIQENKINHFYSTLIQFDTITINEFAGLVNMSVQELYAYLRETKRIQKHKNKPYQKEIDNGNFIFTTGLVNGRYVPTIKLSSKIQKQLLKEIL